MKNIRRITLITVSIFSILLMSMHHNAYARKTASIVIEPVSGKVLYARNANELAYPASLTKAMTVYMIFEALQRGKITLRTKMRVSKNATKREPTKLYLRAGSHITVKTAIEALIIKSANDVATVVAEYFGKSESRFAKMMTQKARAIGMKRTVFRNASGLPNRYQVTTARDMAQLGRRLLLDFPHFYHYFKKRSFKFHGKRFRGHNNVLNLYNGADGIKTGYTRASGFNLLTSAVRNNRRVVAVVLGGRTQYSRDNAMLKLLKKYVQKAAVFTLPNPKGQPFLRQAKAIQSAPTKQPKTIIASSKPLQTRTLSNYNIRSPKSPRSLMIAKNKQIVAQAKAKKPKQQQAQNQAPQTQIANALQDGSNIWQVQVGAYYKKEIAGNMVEKIYDSLPDGLQQHADYYVSKRKNKKRDIYRARIKGLTQNQAQKTCHFLKSKSFGCFVISPT